MIKEPQAEQVVPVGYPVSRRAVLAGPVAAGVLAWARGPAGPAAAQTNSDLGWSGGPANVRVSRDAFTMHAEPSLTPAGRPCGIGGLAGLWPRGRCRAGRVIPSVGGVPELPALPIERTRDDRGREPE